MLGCTRSEYSYITLQNQPQALRPQSSQLVLQLHSPTVWSQQSVLQLHCEGQCKVEISFRRRVWIKEFFRKEAVLKMDSIKILIIL
jgi:hypothetical protein